MKHLLTSSILFNLMLTAVPAWAGFDELFQQSLKHWQTLKQPDLAYSYTTSYESWIGFGQTTQISVQGDTVIGRSFESWRWYYDYNDNGAYKRETLSTWTESASEIGQHAEGEKPKTLDTVYDQCRDDVLSRDPERYEIDFKVDASGLIQTCRARDIYCADDCWEGIDIVKLEL